MAEVVADIGCWTIEIVKRNELHKFVVPKRSLPSSVSP